MRCVSTSCPARPRSTAGKESIEPGTEILLLVKTRRDHYPELEQPLHATHPYELPEIIAVAIDTGLAGYLAWIDANLGAKT
jgi:periplasmic divalent cation tolerance protein